MAPPRWTRSPATSPGPPLPRTSDMHAPPAQAEEAASAKERAESSLGGPRCGFLPMRSDDAAYVRALFTKNDGSPLRAWLKHFDQNNDHCVCFQEFEYGMRCLGFEGDARSIFDRIDNDASGHLSLQEIDEGQTKLWARFREWCVERASGSLDMIRTLLGLSAHEDVPQEGVTCEQFSAGMLRMGWDGNFQAMLFSALDKFDTGRLCQPNFEWLDVEKRRQKRKRLAKQNASNKIEQHAKDRLEGMRIASEFRRFLRTKCGGYIRAWRTVLSPGVEGVMALQKPQFCKVIARLGWGNRARLLWRALDRDEDGTISFDDIDGQSAEALAHFQSFVSRGFGTAREAFRAFDAAGTCRLRRQDFVAALVSRGFNHKVELLFDGLSVTDVILESHMRFLDEWKPPAYLLCPANEEAVAQFKALLLKRSGTYLKAWRRLLDADGSNRCSWSEFQVAAEKIKFCGDIPGAWRAMDLDISGNIALGEIDSDTSDRLLCFKRWADQEFGTVRSMYEVFDENNTGELSIRAFLSNCRIYGYSGDAKELFHTLDTDGGRVLSPSEVWFLDSWALDAAKLEFESVTLAQVALAEYDRRENPPTTAQVDALRSVAANVTLHSSGGKVRSRLSCGRRERPGPGRRPGIHRHAGGDSGDTDAGGAQDQAGPRAAPASASAPGAPEPAPAEPAPAEPAPAGAASVSAAADGAAEEAEANGRGRRETGRSPSPEGAREQEEHLPSCPSVRRSPYERPLQWHASPCAACSPSRRATGDADPPSHRPAAAPAAAAAAAAAPERERASAAACGMPSLDDLLRLPPCPASSSAHQARRRHRRRARGGRPPDACGGPGAAGGPASPRERRAHDVVA